MLDALLTSAVSSVAVAGDLGRDLDEVAFTTDWCAHLIGSGISASTEESAICSEGGRIDLCAFEDGKSWAIEFKLWVNDEYPSKLARHWRWDLQKLRTAAADHTVFGMLITTRSDEETHRTLQEVRTQTGLASPACVANGTSTYNGIPCGWVLWLWQLR